MPDAPTDPAALWATMEAALHGAEARADPNAVYADATAIGQLGQDLVEAAAVLRGRALAKIAVQEHLTVAQLAVRMGKSKTRIQQLMAAGRNPRR